MSGRELRTPGEQRAVRRPRRGAATGLAAQQTTLHLGDPMRFFFLGHPRRQQDDQSIALPVRGDCPSTPLATTHFDDWFGHATTVRPPTDSLGPARRVTFYPQPPVDKGLCCAGSLASLEVCRMVEGRCHAGRRCSPACRCCVVALTRSSSDSIRGTGS